MSLGVAARKRLGAGGFALGCGCKDAKAVAVAVSASSPCSATETSTATTATTATWRRARTHPSASASTGTLTVPSAWSSFLWEDAEGEADGDEVNCKRESSATTPSFSGLLRQLNELEQSVMSCGRKIHHKNYLSPPPPPPPPPPPLPSRPEQRRDVHTGDRRNNKEGQGNFSPPRAPSIQFPTQQHRRVKSIDKVNRQEGDAHFAPRPPPALPLPPEQQLRSVKTVDRGNSKEDGKHLAPPQVPKHRKSKSCDNNGFVSGGGGGRLDGSVAVVKQSEDPLSDFRRSMLNMIVENGIVAGDELRELLRRFLALNAPHHHDAILRAFTEIWNEVFSTTAEPRREPTKPTARRQRTVTPPRRRHPLPAWRV